jgi:hypothetical protein
MYLHHVGHVVRDIGAASALYRRLGFLVPPPAFPVLPGASERPVGAGNTHVSLARNFVELVTVVDGDDLPDDAVLVPLDVPPAAVPQVSRSIAATSARLAGALARREGVHILVLGTPDVDAAATRLAADGVPHGGAQRLRRPSAMGGEPVAIGWLEIDPDAPEGRLALAEDLADGGRAEHPNGATDLVEVILCVPDADLDRHTRRYERYLAQPSREAGDVRTVALGADRVTLVAASALRRLLPGEPAPAEPAIVGYVVRVGDLDAVRERLGRAGLPARTTPAGDVLVPGAAVLGAAVVFRAVR